MTDGQVAVLGGGIGGCLTASALADLGVDVVVIEQHPNVMTGASRWNDGKIHLGYTFTGTSSLATAALMQEGASCFVRGLERTLGEKLPDAWFGEPVTYLVDLNSMVDAETLWERAQAVARLLVKSTTRLPGLRRFAQSHAVLERIAVDRAMASTGQKGIAAAWRTSEVHISARKVAERLRAAVAARDIPVIQGRVVGVEPTDGGWLVRVDNGVAYVAQVVVNCLWETRTLLDRQVIPVRPDVSIRFKWGLFGQRAGLHLAPSTRIVGRFGDIATYANGDAYLSWYPAALAGRSDDGYPPAVADLDRGRVIQETLAGLDLPPSTLDVEGAEWKVAGGYVVAYGHGDIDEPDSPLHERDRPGVHELGPSYISVDTGKYTLGPLMAQRAVEAVTRVLGSDLALATGDGVATAG